MLAEHVLGNGAAPAGGDLMQNRPLAEKHPMPVQFAVDPGRGFVGGDDAGGSQLLPIAVRVSSNPVCIRRNTLAIAPSEIVRPKSSSIIRANRSKPTWWLW